MNLTKGNMNRMKKEQYFKGILFIVLVGLISLNCISNKEKTRTIKADEKKPNILFLLTDDQSFNTINALGNKEISTPNMDRLVRTGTTFTHAHIMGGDNGAVCLPSRAMLLTGKYFHNLDRNTHGMIGSNMQTMPELFKNAGYKTFGTGKWHNAPPSFVKSFTNGGNIFMGGMSNHLKVPLHDFKENGKYLKKDARFENKFSSVLFSESAIEFIKTYEDENPFFMYVAFSSPHDPRMAPEEYANKYNTKEITLPENFMPEHPFHNGEIIIRDENLLPFPRTEKAIKGEIASYYAMISEVDARIGKVIDALDKKGELDNTIIVLAGDNGLAVGQHGLIGKQNLYDHSVRIPLIISGTGIKEGVTTSALCYLQDIFPTLCDLSKIEKPKNIDGLSLLPVLEQKKTEVRSSVFYMYKNFQRGVRNKDWKLIQYLVKGKKTTQLFNIQKDPKELHNLALDPEYKGKVIEMNNLLKDWIVETGDMVKLDEPDWGVPVIKSWETIRREKGLSIDFKGGHE